MPRYHALDTSVRLCVWNPQANPDSRTDGNEGSDAAAADFVATIVRKYAPPPPKKEKTSGPAIGYAVDKLQEEYFEGHEGVDFLGPAIPHYLVKAGKGLFLSSGEDEPRRSSPVVGNQFPGKDASKVQANDSEDTRPSSQPSHADTSLSSIDTEFFTTETEPSNTPERGKANEHPGQLIILQLHSKALADFVGRNKRRLSRP